MPSAGLSIGLLGGFRVRVGDHPIRDEVWRRRKPAGLLKLLALAPGHRLHREQLMVALWPELEATAASANLRKALHYARKALDDAAPGAGELIRSDGDLLILAATGLSIDAELFRLRLVAPGTSTGTGRHSTSIKVTCSRMIAMRTGLTLPVGNSTSSSASASASWPACWRPAVIWAWRSRSCGALSPPNRRARKARPPLSASTLSADDVLTLSASTTGWCGCWTRGSGPSPDPTSRSSPRRSGRAGLASPS